MPAIPTATGCCWSSWTARRAEVDALMAQVDAICRECGAWEFALAQIGRRAALVWKGRKAAFAAMGRISPNYIVQDGVIPRTALPACCARSTR